MSERLAGQVALITGASSGIGEATVRKFIDEGAKVVLADMQVEKGEALAAEFGDQARFIKTDVCFEAQVAAAIEFAVDAFGRLDCLFNNAGFGGVSGEISGTDLSRRIELEGPDDELKQLADTFDNMLERLDLAFENQKEFIHEASHELRNPLAVIRTNVDVVLGVVDGALGVADGLLAALGPGPPTDGTLAGLRQAECGLRGVERLL